MRGLMALMVVASMNAGAVFADDASHRAAAEDLLKSANTDKTMQAAIDTMLDAQLKANKALVPVKDVMKKFLTKHLSYEALKDDLIDLQVKEFTEAELKEIAAFYRTPTGKKFIEKQPVMMQKGAELGMRRVQENTAELQQMIQAELGKKPQEK
jgi:uncharacterized protein